MGRIKKSGTIEWDATEKIPENKLHFKKQTNRRQGIYTLSYFLKTPPKDHTDRKRTWKRHQLVAFIQGLCASLTAQSVNHIAR